MTSKLKLDIELIGILFKQEIDRIKQNWKILFPKKKKAKK